MNRKLDKLGRLVIPKEMRNKLNLKNGDEVKIELTGDKITISNPNKFDLKKYIEDEKNKTDSLEVGYILDNILEKL